MSYPLVMYSHKCYSLIVYSPKAYPLVVYTPKCYSLIVWSDKTNLSNGQEASTPTVGGQVSVISKVAYRRNLTMEKAFDVFEVLKFAKVNLKVQINS